MGTREIVIIAAVAVVVIAVIAFIIIRNNRKKKIKKMIDDLYVRFTAIKTIPLPFKLTRAQAMAKRSEELSKEVEEYARKYEELEKHINEIQEKLNDIEDSLSTISYKEALEMGEEVSRELTKCEDESKQIDDYLESFSKKDNDQREYSTRLKEKFRVVKTTINKNSQLLSISYDGFMNKLAKCEELFSSSEEAMFASDYSLAQSDLEKIDAILDEIKVNANAVPKLIKDTKGVLPLMLDETKRELALTRQRGVYVAHLDIENKIKGIEDELNRNVAKLMDAEVEGVKESVNAAKDELNELNEALADENKAFVMAKDTNDKVFGHIADMEKVENYVRIAYDKDSARFGLEDLRSFLKNMRDNIEKYRQEYTDIAGEISSCVSPSSEILGKVEELDKAIEADMKMLYSYKTTIDKSTDGESRALSQLMKLQLVVSEVETKLAEYSLPAINESYLQDLQKCRDYIGRIRFMTSQIPINIEELNAVLEEAIDFVYKFYNNINNVVGMGVMVENAIIFGNKYRSTFPEVDRELSKAEFQYLNGEYTKALKTAITCMETLFPDDVDAKIMENYQ